MTGLPRSQPGSEHTPTPWHVSPHSHAPIYIAAPDQGMTAFVGIVPCRMMTGRREDTDRANAAFIVEAVNNHDTLLNNVEVMKRHVSGAADEIAALKSRVEELTKALESAKASVNRAIASYAGDPADNQFLKGHLAALEVVRDEAFATGSMLSLEDRP